MQQMNNNKESSLEEQDLIPKELVHKFEAQDLFNQGQNKRATYNRDLVSALEQPQQTNNKIDQKLQQNQQVKRPQTSNNVGKPQKSQEEKNQSKTQRPNSSYKQGSSKQSQALYANPSTSNIVKTISKRMNNFEQLTAQLKINDNEFLTYTDEKNRLQLQVSNMKKEVASLQAQLEELNKNIDKMHNEKVSYQKQNEQISSKQTSLYLELQNNSRETSDLQSQQAEQENNLKELSNQIEFEKKACLDFNDYIKALKKKISDITKEKDNIKARSVSMQKQSQQLRSKIENQVTNLFLGKRNSLFYAQYGNF